MIWHGSGTSANARTEGRAFLLVDRMWQNPNRIPAVQGPVVTIAAVRQRLV
jgi:hypothetical protein